MRAESSLNLTAEIHLTDENIMLASGVSSVTAISYRQKACPLVLKLSYLVNTDMPLRLNPIVGAGSPWFGTVVTVAEALANAATRKRRNYNCIYFVSVLMVVKCR